MDLNHLNRKSTIGGITEHFSNTRSMSTTRKIATVSSINDAVIAFIITTIMVTIIVITILISADLIIDSYKFIMRLG